MEPPVVIKKRKYSVRISAGPHVDIRIPTAISASTVPEEDYNAARLRMCEVLDRLVNSDDMKLVMSYCDLKKELEGGITKFGLVYAFRDNSNQTELLCSTPPGWGIISYDKKNLDIFAKK